MFVSSTLAMLLLTASSTTASPPCPISCPLTPAPLCGSNLKTYLNSCHLTLASCTATTPITAVHPGPCTKTPEDRHCKVVRCSDAGPEVCGSDGVTYWNDCMLYMDGCSKGIERVFVGKCEDAEILFGGEEEGVIGDGSFSECDGIRCRMEEENVCGSDGVTYLNQCFLTIAQCHDKKVQFQHEGECERKAEL
ncbi:hypothetical protein HDU67_005732 [Dinochytrium kinnereticum]|nr:hypothetical protein HDU67_005732 [Dinochytrium kinnereticum]